jgi:hypothetical protein
MTPVLVAVLAGALAADPLPDNKAPIDSLYYSFTLGGVFGPGGSLKISADNEVSYFYSSAPHTGSGGTVVSKNWELTKEERMKLFTKLVDDGLLELAPGGPATSSIRVTRGRWRMTVTADKLPERVMRHLRPLLVKAHPGAWAVKEAAVKEPPAKPSVLAYVIYHFRAKENGDQTALRLFRTGKVLYSRQPSGGAKPIQVEWTVPAKDAEALLDGLVADGLFDLKDAGDGAFPSHMIEGSAGRWSTSFHVKDLPESASGRLLPLLRKADAEFWK